MTLLIYGVKKNDTNERIYKIERDSQTCRMDLWLPEEKEGLRGGIDWEFGTDKYTLIDVK